MFGIISILLGISACCPTLVFGLTEESAKEGSCINPPPVVDQSFDMDWALKEKIWYPIYGSKEGYYRSVKDLVQNNETAFSKLQEDALSKSSCLKSEWTKDKVLFSGLNGQVEEFELSSPSKGTIVYKPKSKGAGGYGEVTLTDGKSYIFFAECWDGNEEGWNVISNSKNGLDKATEDKIYAHAKSLGFKEKYFFKLDYSQCGDQIPSSSSEEIISGRSESIEEDAMIPAAATFEINPYKVLAISEEEFAREPTSYESANSASSENEY